MLEYNVLRLHVTMCNKELLNYYSTKMYKIKIFINIHPPKSAKIRKCTIRGFQRTPNLIKTVRLTPHTNENVTQTKRQCD